MGDSLHSDSWLLAPGVTMSVLQNPLRTHIEHCGVGAPISVPAHWHSYQAEAHIVLKGRIKVTRDAVTQVMTPADGVVVTGKGVVHGFEGFAGEEFVLEEVAQPGDETNEQKILFFRNLCAPGVMQSLVRTIQVFYHGDGYPAFPFPFNSRRLEWLFVVVVGGWVAPLLGYKLGDERLRMDPERFPASKKD
ncbi:hypothetical protein C8R46DRAFT_913401 [Mycena filopes]|nr:hypothetical protein C8R46DRAFT_913401 [Mycena filopes]